jgi:hypothetical protein
VTQRRFPPSWRVELIPGGFKVLDAKGQALAYFYLRKGPADASTRTRRAGSQATSPSCRALLGAGSESELANPLYP